MTAFPGNIYGVVLNDRDEQAMLATEFNEKPYGKPPVAPVVFMKPRTCMLDWSRTTDPNGTYRASTSLAVLFAQDAAAVTVEQVARCIGATTLAIDLSLPQPNYYRPAVAFRNGDGTLVLGDWEAPIYPEAIALSVDGQASHNWTLGRLVRPVTKLVSDISQFLTLKAGDVLLIGFPGDAPEVRFGQSICAKAQGMADTACVIGGTRP